MAMVWCAGARMLRLRIRFCLAPISSSPSSSNIAKSPKLTKRNSGTCPASETSVTRALPSASASSRSR